MHESAVELVCSGRGVHTIALANDTSAVKNFIHLDGYGDSIVVFINCVKSK
jgi:hypothetical protein